MAEAWPSPEQRHALIAEAAFQLAESRGFQPGQEVDDWLAAERLVEERLANPGL